MSLAANSNGLAANTSSQPASFGLRLVLALLTIVSA